MKRSRQTNRPETPKQGLVFWVQEGNHWAFGDAYSVGEVNGRSFYIHSRGETSRYLLSEWHWWLDQRFAEGTVYLNGRQLENPAVDPIEALPSSDTFSVDLPGRDQRFLRASQDVLTQYQRSRSDGDEGFVHRTVSQGKRRYVVTARPDWASPPTCTCPDANKAARRLTGGFCKHAIAVCIMYDDLRCQLLDLLV
ncbi:MAG: SWIM zinc finger family protein [Myxococcota bacterium]|nr:SWIM zinc finger family protein [Myxococcota bacterium]